MKQQDQSSTPDELKRKTEKLNELQSSFIQNVNHELRTPIAIILGYADLLRNEELGRLVPEQQEAIFVIANHAHELRTLVERITVLLTIGADQVYPLSLSLTDIVTEVVETRRPKAIKAEIRLVFQPPASTLPQMAGDPKQLRQAIDCLVENALKFTPAGGQVEVCVEAETDWISLIITDTGIGIAEKELADIFNAFYQVDGSMTRQYNGLGLGLTVAKGIIEAHGGQIEVESQPGQGSQFTVKLPTPLFAAKEGQPDQGSSKLRRILIVDDEENVTLMLQEGLEQLPACEIMTATGGEQALQLFEQQPFDLVITDYNMPEVDGLTLATHIRRSYPQTSIIMLTGYANDRLRKQAAEVSIQRVLDKPIKLKEICRAASETLNET